MLSVVFMLSVSSVSICLSLLVEGQTPQLYGRLQPKVRHLESTVCPSYLCPCYFLSVHGVAAVYVSIGRLHSLSVFYRASHNTPATPPPPTPRPPEGPQRQKRTPRETPPHADHKTAPTPKRTPERATPQSPGPHQKNAAQLRPKSTKEPKQGQPRDPHEKRPPTTPTPATPGPQEAEKPTEAKRPKYRGTPCKYVYFLTKLTFLDIQSSDSVFWVGRLQS